MSVLFVECASCASKPGSPILCMSCLANRETITSLQNSLEAANNRKAAWDRVREWLRAEDSMPGVDYDDREDSKTIHQDDEQVAHLSYKAEEGFIGVDLASGDSVTVEIEVGPNGLKILDTKKSLGPRYPGDVAIRNAIADYFNADPVTARIWLERYGARREGIWLDPDGKRTVGP